MVPKKGCFSMRLRAIAIAGITVLKTSGRPMRQPEVRADIQEGDYIPPSIGVSTRSLKAVSNSSFTPCANDGWLR